MQNNCKKKPKLKFMFQKHFSESIDIFHINIYVNMSCIGNKISKTIERVTLLKKTENTIY